MQVRGNVLEIGTGSGVLAALSLYRGASSVVATDINPAAVAAARKNVPEAMVLQSDLFENVTGRYHTLIFAAPWSEGTITTPLDYALYDCGVVERFFQQAEEYLEPDGTIWLQYCDAYPGNFSRLFSWIGDNGFAIAREWSYKTWGALVKRDVNVILYEIRRA